MREMIQSRQNPKIRSVCGLSEKKKRRESGLFRFDGIKLLKEALDGGLRLHSVYVRTPASEYAEALLTEAIGAGRLSEDRIFDVSDSVFEKMSEEKSPEGVLSVAYMPERLHRRLSLAEAEQALACSDGKYSALLLVEAVRDPGNLGTVMRTCAALGIRTVVLSDDCADLYHARTLRSAMGAIFRLPTVTVSREDFPALIAFLRRDGRRIFATALRADAERIGAFSLRCGDCFVIGNEGHGLSEATVEACDGAAMIPMCPGNESLNAAAAAAICVWETVRAENGVSVGAEKEV